MKKTLQELTPGEKGVIISVDNKSPAIKRRLTDMGLTPGTAVAVMKLAPLGDPIELKLRGYNLSLRKEDAARIIVSDASVKTDAIKPGYTVYPARPNASKARVAEQMRLDHEHERLHHLRDEDREEHDSRKIRIALAGNPNSGKTTLFNALTGSNQYVGNWPGVTVEKKEGTAELDGKPVTIVDLPGIYSLSPYSMEEVISRDYIINNRPDVIINIIDATNLERNLYLTIQLLELERPMIVALNFMDEVEKNGDNIDAEKLSEALGIPCIPISAKTGKNLDKLLETAHMQIHIGYNTEPDDLYDDFTHEIHHEMDALLHDSAYAAGIPAHWASIKLLEGDSIVEKALALDEETKKALDRIIARYEASSVLGDRETLIADSRYRFIEKAVKVSVNRAQEESRASSSSDRIDRVLTHKIWALPIFIASMLVIFLITFGPFGTMLSDYMAYFIENILTPGIYTLLESIGTAPWLISLVCDGIVAGVGGVLTFLPQIALLFFFLSILEDSGYMARGAFIMDRLLRNFGLSGKAFIPMLMGFGCTVPAVMGARTMENEKDRRLTIMLIPFMSCSAKLPVYGLIASAFFGSRAGIVVFSLYIMGMLAAILTGIILSKTVFKGDTAAFVMELPPYRMPALKNSLLHLWERIRGFIQRAGTVILVMTIVLWVLQNFDTSFKMTEDASKSILAVIGGAIAPVFTLNGFGSWQAAVALLTGFIAKETVVASLSMSFGFSLAAENSAVAAALSGVFTPLSAYSFLVFVLLYVPCVAAVSTIYKEMNSLKWTLFSVLWQIMSAYVASALIFQLGRLAGLG
jgi:ferrous iron transport protein B